MKKEKDIIEFFGKYSNALLPEDKERFMGELKDRIDRLPVPSSFDRTDPEVSKEYCERVMKRLKTNYKRKKRDAVISCVFSIVIAEILMIVLYALGAFSISPVITSAVLIAAAFVLLGFIAYMFPPTLEL